ncbi:hypothetical protein ACET3Z_020725 [Daucus carota]
MRFVFIVSVADIGYCPCHVRLQLVQVSAWTLVSRSWGRMDRLRLGPGSSPGSEIISKVRDRLLVLRSSPGSGTISGSYRARVSAWTLVSRSGRRVDRLCLGPGPSPGSGIVSWVRDHLQMELVLLTRRKLLQKGITPFVNLNHYDVPQALQERYSGLLSREIVILFPDVYGDRVKNWFTFNEPRVVTVQGFDEGSFPSGRCS